MTKEFSRARSTRDLVLSVLLIVVGLLCVVFKTPVSVNILGCCIIILGLVLLFMLKTLRKDSETGLKYYFKTRFYPAKRKDEVLKALSGNAGTIDWSESGGAEESLRVDIYYNRAANKAYIQCFEFIPYEYRSCSDWFEVDLDKSGNLLS